MERKKIILSKLIHFMKYLSLVFLIYSLCIHISIYLDYDINRLMGILYYIIYIFILILSYILFYTIRGNEPWQYNFKINYIIFNNLSIYFKLPYLLLFIYFLFLIIFGIHSFVNENNTRYIHISDETLSSGIISTHIAWIFSYFWYESKVNNQDKK